MKRTWLWVGVSVIVLAVLYLPSLGIERWSILSWLLVLLCPLIHLLGFHGTHGKHAHTDGGNTAAPQRPSALLKGPDEA